MPSWQAKCFDPAVKLLIRRRRWGNDAHSLARRARRLFGSSPIYQWFRTRDLTITEVRAGDVNGEWLSTDAPADGIIMYIHGGGFVSCSAATHRPISAALARLTNARVFSIEYRLAPEHPFPAGLDDLVTGYKWLLKQETSADRISVAGDSAGGSLALSLLMRLRDEAVPLPSSAVCFSPWTDLAGTGDSIEGNSGKCAMFWPENMKEFSDVYLFDGSGDVTSASPIHGDARNLPPVLFQVGSTELLLDDSRRMHEKILAAGGESKLEVYDGVFHCWQMLDGILPEARAALTSAAEFIRYRWH
jgi:epsilon-lactone hydrolase